jgi:hypothetical protein
MGVARIAIATVEANTEILFITRSPFYDLTAARVAGSAPERFPLPAIESASFAMQEAARSCAS